MIILGIRAKRGEGRQRLRFGVLAISDELRPLLEQDAQDVKNA